MICLAVASGCGSSLREELALEGTRTYKGIPYLSLDNKYVALSTGGNVVDLWNMKDYSKHVLQNHDKYEDRPYPNICFSHNSRYMAVLYQVRDRFEWVQCTPPKRQWFLVQSAFIPIWDLSCFSEGVTIPIPDNRDVRDVAFVRGTSCLVTFEEERRPKEDRVRSPTEVNHFYLRFWDYSTQICTAEFPVYLKRQDIFVSLANDGRHMILRRNERHTLYETWNVKPVVSYDSTGQSFFLTNGSAVVSIMNDEVVAQDSETGHIIKRVHPDWYKLDGYQSMSMSQDMNRLAFVGTGAPNIVAIVNANTGNIESMTRCCSRSKEIRYAMFSPDGKHLFTNTRLEDRQDRHVEPEFRMWMIPVEK